MEIFLKGCERLYGLRWIDEHARFRIVAIVTSGSYQKGEYSLKDIEVSLATEKDRHQLLDHFRHYQNQELIEKRVNCYLSHNFTAVAKDKDEIVGVVQWYIKEDPRDGIVEFEEVYVQKEYRGKGIGSLLIEFAIQAVKDYFNEIVMKPKKIFLFSNKENEVAGALFEKCGFRLETGYFYSLEL